MTLLKTFTNIVLHIVQKTDAKNFAIYLSDGNNNTEILTKVQFIDATVQDDIQLMDHPKEDGAVITDHEIRNPNSISLRALISDDDNTSLNEIQNYYKSATLLVIKAKGEIFPNVTIAGKPYKVDATYFDKTAYDIRFRTIQTAETQYIKMKIPQVKKKKNASTQKLGHKQAQKTKKPYNSILSGKRN